jgi:hypothetical protein
VADQKVKKVENLRFDRDQLGPTAQLAASWIK